MTPQNLSLHVEDKDTQEFVVNVTTNNTRPDRGYEVGTLSSNPEKIKITGPISLINKIDRGKRRHRCQRRIRRCD